MKEEKSDYIVCSSMAPRLSAWKTNAKQTYVKKVQKPLPHLGSAAFCLLLLVIERRVVHNHS